MKRITLGDRWRYAFDNVMSKGTVALIFWLGVLSAIIIFAVAAVVYIAGLAPEVDFFHLVWMGLMRTLDAGTMGGDEGSWPFLFAMLAVTLGGVFVISTLIGILTTGIEAKLEELRKGRSAVLEKGHTVILGWSDQVFSIIPELVIANENQQRGRVVILAPKDKVEMEEEIRAKCGPTGKTRVICRSGNPMDLNDLEIPSLPTSRSIIVLSPSSQDPDADVVKTVLAVTNHPHRRPAPYHIVAEIRAARNVDVVKMVGKDEVEVILVSEFVARVIAQTCRQSGLSVVYTELLDYGGDEIYFFAHDALTGKTFGDTLMMFEDSAVMGVVPRDGTPVLNPPMDTPLKEGDQLIVIAEDDDTTRLSGKTEWGVDRGAVVTPTPRPPYPERTLILGWNRLAPAVINELDAYVAPGSTVTVVADYERGQEELGDECEGLRNLAFSFVLADTTDRRALDRLDAASFDHVILLAYADAMTPDEADARTLMTLLHLRDIADKNDRKFSIVSQMLDVRNRNLAEVTRADDFIVSDKLVSLMLAQVSENKYLNAVFADIFDPEGSEIYLKPAADYVRPGVPVNFYTVVDEARRRGEVAIGYRIAAYAKDAGRSYGVVINPAKSQKVSFAEGDKIIVVAEE